MPLKPLPGQGIELSLGEYTRLRAFQGGGWFWDHDNQRVIRECLSEFLPRVEERPDRTGAVFQHFIGGAEAASKSRAIGQKINRVPKSQFDRLQRALETLKQKAQDPKADPNAKQIIEKFRLPDPAKDPELYRLHGPPWNRRLLILWGCEREPGASLPPAVVLSRMPFEPRSTAWLRWLPVLLGMLLLLLLLLFLTHRLWPWNERRRERTAMSGPLGLNATPPALTGIHNVAANGVSPALSPAATPNAASALSSNTASAEMPAPSSSIAPDAAASAQMSLAPTASSPAPASPLSPTPSASSSPVEDGNDSVPRVKPSPGVSMPPAGATPQPSPTTKDAPNTPTPSRAASPPPSAPAPSASGPSTKSDKPSRPASASSPHIEIEDVSGSPTPHGDKMDVILTATGYGQDESVLPLRIEYWEVDGAAQHDAKGRDLTAGRLSTSLPKGVHRVKVVGILENGLPVKGEAVLDVQIKTEGNVKVKPDRK